MKSLIWCFHSDQQKCLSIVECHESRCLRSGHSVPYGPIEREIIKTLYKKTPPTGSLKVPGEPSEAELTTTLEDIPPSGKIS